MNQVASPGQLRMSFIRWALVTVPLVMLLGLVSGGLSGTGEENRWYAELAKPAAQPPGSWFGIVWPILYALEGFALAIVLHARGAGLRGKAVGLFIVQFLLSLAWTPLFFGMHKITAAFYLLVVIALLALATAALFYRIRPLAGLLLVPYVLWLIFASYLSYEIDRLNPDGGTLVTPAATTQI